MINRLRSNRAERPSMRQKFKGRNREIIKPGLYQEGLIDDVSAKELDLIKKRINSEAIERRKKERVLNLILIILGVSLFAGFMIMIG